MNVLKFTKMHGLGNDFIVIDGISQKFDPLTAPLSQWSDRYCGVGFDQLLVVEPPLSDEADFRYRIFNADGGEVEQCGNGARCFARFVFDKGLTAKKEILVETAKGLIKPELLDGGLVRVNMGQPKFRPSEIPFEMQNGENEFDLRHRVETQEGAVEVSCVNMGNPHAVLVVDDVQTAEVGRIGKELESHHQFPAKVNVGFLEFVDRTAVRLRVFERGVGETQACGTGACAAVVAGIRLGALDSGKDVEVSLPGGKLYISWEEGGDVWMTGPAQTVFEGELVY